MKGIYDSWPPDDEQVALDLGAGWRRGAELVTTGARATASAGGDARAAWDDSVGADFAGKVDEHVRSVSELHPPMLDLAARGEHYGRELESTKTDIATTIAANENTYALLGNPLLGAVGPLLRKGFAASVAIYLQGMVESRAATLEAGPTGTPAGQDPNLDAVADAKRDAADKDFLAAVRLGEWRDDVIDGAGYTLGETLRAFGMSDLADTIERDSDLEGDEVAEETLARAAAARNEAYDEAQAVDGRDRARVVYISRERYPASAQHIDEAQGGLISRGFEQTRGPAKPSELTVMREGSEARRNAATKVVPPRSDLDRDEYPPAVAEEGGAGSSVKYIDPKDNSGAGSSMGHQLNGRGRIARTLGYGRADDGDKFVLRTFDGTDIPEVGSP